MYSVLDRDLLARTKKGPSTPLWNIVEEYGPWTLWNLLYHVPPLSPFLFTRNHDLNTRPEQSGPSPPSSNVARLGVSSWLLSFQQPPAYWYPSSTATEP